MCLTFNLVMEMNIKINNTIKLNNRKYRIENKNKYKLLIRNTAEKILFKCNVNVRSP